MNETANNQAYACKECPAGMMHLQYITYFTWLSDELITVPNFPAWVCDVCGRRDYDERAIAWLSMLLNPDAGKSTTRARWPRPPLEKRDSTRPSLG